MPNDAEPLEKGFEKAVQNAIAIVYATRHTHVSKYEQIYLKHNHDDTMLALNDGTT